jgi:hypothetical protein
MCSQIVGGGYGNFLNRQGDHETKALASGRTCASADASRGSDSGSREEPSLGRKPSHLRKPQTLVELMKILRLLGLAFDYLLDVLWNL